MDVNMDKSAKSLVQIAGFDHLKTLYRCGGFYRRQKGQGPLVGYAGRYQDASDQWKQYVGEVYYNFAKAEEWSHVLDWFAKLLAKKIQETGLVIDYVLGAPIGGLAIATVLNSKLGRRYVFPEKQVVALATADSREQSVLAFKRHKIELGSNILLVEDVCNNFSTTEAIRQLVKKSSSEVVGIACELNHSGQQDWQGLPVIALLDIPTEQFQQDDPAVAEDIANGNVVWKPKDEWPRLMEAMQEAVRRT